MLHPWVNKDDQYVTMSKSTLALTPKYIIYYIFHAFNIFGVMYVILMLHAYVTILRGLTGLILWLYPCPMKMHHLQK